MRPFIPKVGIFFVIFLLIIYSTVDLPPLRLHCVSDDAGIEPRGPILSPLLEGYSPQRQPYAM